MGATKQYINGLFVKKKTGQYGEFFSLGILKKDFINQIESLDADARGFINLTMSAQKADPTKYSTSVDTWKPKEEAMFADTPSEAPATSSYGSGPEDDSLPF